MKRTLLVTHRSTGKQELIDVSCGSDRGARRLPARIGRALHDGSATAILDYDGLPRTAITSGGVWYMRLKHAESA